MDKLKDKHKQRQWANVARALELCKRRQKERERERTKLFLPIKSQRKREIANKCIKKG